MLESLPKIASFIFFIWLGWFLRRSGMLKESAFAAVSALVLNVTLPCLIVTNLNGIKIEGLMLLVVFLGFLTNALMLAYAWTITRRITDEKKRDFARLNLAGFPWGPWRFPIFRRFIRQRGSSPPSCLTWATFL